MRRKPTSVAARPLLDGSVVVIALAVLVAVASADYHFSHVALAPIVAIPLIVIAYYGSLWQGLALGVLAAVLFGYIEYNPAFVTRIEVTSLPINTAIMGFGFSAIVIAAALLQREARKLAEVQRALGSERRNTSRAQRLARTDRLTGLLNRRGFDEELERLRLECIAAPFILAVLFIDLDGFKQINDVHGHAVGDIALQTAARRVAASVRANDVVARLGGDEFGVLCSGSTQAELDANRIVSQIQHAFAEPMAYKDLSIALAASIGAALSPEDGTDIAALVALADKRMYEHKGYAKSRGSASA